MADNQEKADNVVCSLVGWKRFYGTKKCWNVFDLGRQVPSHQGVSLLSRHYKVPYSEWLKQQEFIFSQFSRLRSSRSRCQLIWFLIRALFLACGSPLCPYTAERERERERESTLWFLFQEKPGLWDQGFTLRASFNLNHLLKDPISYTVTRGLRFQHMNFGEIHSVHSNQCGTLDLYPKMCSWVHI